MLAASDSIDLRPETGPTDTDLVSLALRRRADTIAKSERVHRHDPHTLAERVFRQVGVSCLVMYFFRV